MPWHAKVRGILEMWFPGQEGGWATADLILGRANPAGRLPITFPARAEDTPALEAGHPERAGANAKVVYSEGIFGSYRHHGPTARTSLSPFGRGLSYATFAYSGLRATATRGGARVSFSVKNTGGVAGIDTPQLYVSAPEGPTPVPMAKKTLAGFARVSL